MLAMCKLARSFALPLTHSPGLHKGILRLQLLLWQARCTVACTHSSSLCSTTLPRLTVTVGRSRPRCSPIPVPHEWSCRCSGTRVSFTMQCDRSLWPPHPYQTIERPVCALNFGRCTQKQCTCRVWHKENRAFDISHASLDLMPCLIHMQSPSARRYHTYRPSPHRHAGK
jgi:hypothetical protein